MRLKRPTIRTNPARFITRVSFAAQVNPRHRIFVNNEYAQAFVKYDEVNCLVVSAREYGGTFLRVKAYYAHFENITNQLGKVIVRDEILIERTVSTKDRKTLKRLRIELAQALIQYERFTNSAHELISGNN